MTKIPIIQNNYIYFDANSGNQILPEVKQMVINFMDHPLNPSSIHYLGQQANGFIEDTRDCLKQYLNLKNDYGVIFTSGGSEANNLAICGVESDNINNNTKEHIVRHSPELPHASAGIPSASSGSFDSKYTNNFDLYICTAAEHKSVLYPIKTKKNFIIASITKDGIVNLERLIKIIEENKDKKIFLSLIYINNETGAINNLVEIVRQVRSVANNIVIHSDMGQAVGKLPDLNDLDFQKLDVDLATIIGYKFGAMVGAGALIYRKNLTIKPMILGGSQEYDLRAGTENVMAIYSMKLALDALYEGGLLFSSTSTLSSTANEVSALSSNVTQDILRSSAHTNLSSSDERKRNAGDPLGKFSTLNGYNANNINQWTPSIDDKHQSENDSSNLRDYFESQLKQIIQPDHLIIFSENTNRIWNTSYFAITTLEAKTQLMFFNSNKIYIGTGSACSAGLDEDSHVLSAMGFDEKIRKCTIRVSLNIFSTKDRLDILLEKLQQLYCKFK